MAKYRIRQWPGRGYTAEVCIAGTWRELNGMGEVDMAGFGVDFHSTEAQARIPISIHQGGEPVTVWESDE